MDQLFADVLQPAAAAQGAVGFSLPPGNRQLEYRVAAGIAIDEDIAEKICASWVCLHNPANGYQQRLRAVLHEAFSNALLHGCLEISGFKRNSTQDLLRQEREMCERLAEPEYACRQITIQLRSEGANTVVSVEDEGPGYTFDTGAEDADPRLCIRGMQLIHKLSDKVEIDKDGRRIVIAVAAQS